MRVRGHAKKMNKIIRLNKCFIIGIACILLYLVIIYKTEFLKALLTKLDKRKVLNPPELTEEEEEVFNFKFKDLLKESKKYLAEQVSEIVQKQIRNIQITANCSGWNIFCGHYQSCGFGCQVHHRIGCLMISYALNLPLIHDENEAWIYPEKWSDIFYPLGANCTPGPNTFYWSWKNTDLLSLKNRCIKSSKGCIHLEYPLSEGIPVSKKLGDLVETFHENPFLWWVGQFMKYGLRLRDNFRKRITEDKNSIGFHHPIIGIHVRRTDKVIENPESHHEIEEYMKVADSILKNVTESKNSNFQMWPESRRVFLASDDSEMLAISQKRFPEWNIIGFTTNNTLNSEDQRKNALYDIVRDTLILSECDFVICGYTSNVCRLLLEILSFKFLNSEERLKSLDGSYSYVLQKHSIEVPKVLKIEKKYKLEIFDSFTE